MKKAMNQSTTVFIMNAISVFALLFMIFSLYCYGNVQNKVNTANEQRFGLTYNANRFMNGSSYLTNEVRAYAATGEEEHYNNYWNEINNLKNRDIGVASMKEIGITSEEQAMIDEMSSLSNTLVPLEEEAMNNVKAGERELALGFVYGTEYSTSIQKINAIKSQFLETLDRRALAEVDRLIGVTHFILFFLILSITVVVILQVSNLRIVRKRILRPLLDVRDQMGSISKGDLSAPFTMESNTSEMGMLADSIHTTKRELKRYIGDINDKLAQMASGNMNVEIGHDYRGEFLPIQDAMRGIRDSLNSALTQIENASKQVSFSSGQVADGAQALSNGATEQTSAVEQLSVSLRDLSEQVARTSEDAQLARSCSVEAAGQLQISNDKMKQLTTAMEDVTSASNQISGIIKTIEDIAFQTNILALNAAVEAARAGEAGKGFAVVADEVRNLAAKSADAAKTTTVLIENTLRSIQQGSSLSGETTDALLGVVSGAMQSTQLMERIADSSTRQAQALQQVTIGIDQISNVVQTTAATAEESAAASQQLSGQAQALKNLTEQFTLAE